MWVFKLLLPAFRLLHYFLTVNHSLVEQERSFMFVAQEQNKI